MNHPQIDATDRHAQLEALFGSAAEALSVAGNRPIDLQGKRAWLVTAGLVEVFAVRRADGTTSARTHVLSASAGQVLFGLGPSVSSPSHASMPPGSDGAEATTVLIAVAHPGSRLLTIDTSVLTRLARDPGNIPPLEAAIEGWVTGLFGRLPRGHAPSRFTPLHAGTETTFDTEDPGDGTPGDAGKSVSSAGGGQVPEGNRGEGSSTPMIPVARAAEGMVWVRHTAGGSQFLGRTELAIDSADRLLPMAENTWLVASPGTVLSCIATANLLRSGTLWGGLDFFHQVFIRHLGLDLTAAGQDDRDRLASRLERDQQTLRTAHTRLASVLGQTAHAELSMLEVDEPLFAACQLVAEHQGISLRPPPGPPTADLDRRIHRIVDASRIRHRRVLLRDQWWQQDVGPLLAFIELEEAGKKTRRPVALLPKSARRYELVDPTTQTRTTVDQDVAAQLAAAAIMFYPALPERPVGIRDLLRVSFRGRRPELLTVLMMGIGGGVLALLVPLVTAQLFGNVIPGADRSQLFEMTLALAIAAIGAAAFQITRSIAVLRLTGKIDGSLQAAVWDRLLSLPSSFFRRYTVGDLANRAMGVDAIRDLLVGNVTTALLGLIFSIFSFGLLFYYSASLAALASGMIALLIVTTSLFAYLQLRHQRALLAIQGKIASVLFGLIHGVGKLRASGSEKRAYALWAEHFTRQRQRTFQAQRLANAQMTFSAAYAIASTLALYALMGLALEGDLPISRFLAFSAAYGQVQASALTFVSMISGVLAIVPTYERLSPILRATPEVDETKVEAGQLSGDIELAHVSFRYQEDGPLTLTDISIHARPGELVALVGPSGSGKSTCLRLLLGFEKPGAGSIYFDGQDVASLDLQSVRRQTGVVLQNSRPMAGDIFRNIVGTTDLGINEAWEAAEMAGLADDVRAMPMGMHTVISEGAGTFSGGQIQRLMIARAIVARPRILIFDEATSALDNQTQKLVAQSLERLKATRIVVAHRLSTIENADRIFVLDAGRVVEEGSYQELIAKNGLFSRLAARQLA